MTSRTDHAAPTDGAGLEDASATGRAAAVAAAAGALVGLVALALSTTGGALAAGAVSAFAAVQAAVAVLLAIRYTRTRRESARAMARNEASLQQLRELEERLTHQAFHDPLTGLANRSLFLEMTRRSLARRSRDSTNVAVLFLDLDDFKAVNDGFGHATGDELLIAIARRVRGCLRSSDWTARLEAGDTAARLGGDEFAILIDDAAQTGAVVMIAERILRALEPPLTVFGRELPVRASIGIAFGSAGATAESLLRDADVAMYRAKTSGKGRYEIYEDGMAAEIREKMELRSDLARGIRSGQLLLHYQPIVDLESAELRSVEALVRWLHPERGLVPPGQFIDLAEETGLIGEIGEWVLREACRQAQEWQTRFPAARWLGMSVNVSANQLRMAGFPRQVREVIEEHRLDPSTITLEITEGLFMEGWTRVRATLDELRAVGVRLAIDDFGTGYSSLSRLMELPVDTLKIPKPFVDALAGVSGNATLARTVVRIGDSIGVKTVAEGIETVDRWRQLRHLGCDLGQGYLFGRPVAADELEAQLVQAFGGVATPLRSEVAALRRVV